MEINLTIHFLTHAVTENISLKPESRSSLEIKKNKIKKVRSVFQSLKTQIFLKATAVNVCFCVDRILLKGFVVQKAPFSGFS